MTSILPVSLVIVADFATEPKSWDGEMLALDSFLHDEEALPAEVVIGAKASARSAPEPDWTRWAVPIRVVYVESDHSATVYNHAALETTEDLVAFSDADCLGAPGWLAALYRVISSDPRLDAVSGRTIYEGDTRLSRVSALYDRAYIEEVDAEGFALHLSNNGAIYRRTFLESFPYDDEPSPFITGHQRQLDALAGGARFGMAREALQVHDFEGWSFVRDLRLNKGLQCEVMRRRTGGAGKNSPPRLRWRVRTLLRNLVQEFGYLRLYFRAYCKPLDLPLALIFLVLVRPLEWRGMSMGAAGEIRVKGTSFT